MGSLFDRQVTGRLDRVWQSAKISLKGAKMTRRNVVRFCNSRPHFVAYVAIVLCGALASLRGLA